MDICSKLISFWGLVLTACGLVFGIAFFIGFANIWEGLQSMNEGTGAMFGAFFGLVAILLGAFVNAKLNRNRDDRLFIQDRQALAGGLKGELIIIYTLVKNRHLSHLKYRDTLKNAELQTTLTINYQEQYKSAFYNSTISKLGILGGPIVANLSTIYEFLSFLESEKEQKVSVKEHFTHNSRVTNLQNVIIKRIPIIIEELERIE